MQHIAIIDMGTNTFNLLIAEKGKDGKPNFIYSRELPVEIGKGGIHKGHITDEATERAVNALHLHNKTIAEHNIKDVYAFATSAVRDAGNQKEFSEKVKKEAGIDIHILSGEDEAKWIYEGVKHASVLGEHVSLIMDIGGGSTEFIIANSDTVFWKKSYPLGVTRLYEMFNQSDRLMENQREVGKYIADMIVELIEAAKEHSPVELIGSSGSFESFAQIILSRTGGEPNPQNGYDFSMEEFDKLYSELMKSTLEERLQIQGLISMRAPMFAYSGLLTKSVLIRLGIKKMKLSHYALKEGIAGHLLEKA
ncbi:MAG TPA: phosphatase [Bacteroidia bacterium]|nr:phosphatase [Bacteroidia bacterium]